MPHVPHLRGFVLDLPAATSTFLTNVTDIALGILATIQTVQPDIVFNSTIQFGLVYYPLSLSLTILLTLMIILRLALHARNIQNALGSRANASGLYKAIIAILVESYALYTISFIVSMVLDYLLDPLRYLFSPVFAGTQVSHFRMLAKHRDSVTLSSDRWNKQVIAPLLVILRVANRRALTNDSIAPGNLSSIHFTGQGESMDGNGIVPGENPTSLTEANNPDTPSEYSTKAENTIDETPR